VDQPLGLLDNRFEDLRMPVPDIHDADAGREVQV